MPPSPEPARLASSLAKFSLVGVANTAVDYGLFAWLTLGAGWTAPWAHGTSVAAATLNSYLWNRNWTFRGSGGRAGVGQMVRFVTVNLASFGISLAALVALQAAGLPPLAAKAGAMLVTLVVNFAGNRWWVFPQRAEVLPAAPPGTPGQNTGGGSSSR